MNNHSWTKLFPCSVSVSCSVRLEQGTVTSLLEEKGTITGVQYKSKNGEQKTAYAPLTIVCDGCFSNLRRSLCNPMVRWLPLYAVVLQNRHLLSLRICDWLQNDLPTAWKQWISFSTSEPFYLLYFCRLMFHLVLWDWFWRIANFLTQILGMLFLEILPLFCSIPSAAPRSVVWLMFLVRRFLLYQMVKWKSIWRP